MADICYSGVMDIMQGLKRLRDIAGYSQEGMAKSAGIKTRTWSDWEKNPPTQLKALVLLAKNHNVTIDFILGLTDNPHPIAGRELSGAEVEILEVFQSMPEQAQGAAIASARAIGDYANDIIAANMASDSAAAAGGIDELKLFKNLLRRLTIRLGSVEAAVHFLSTVDIPELARSNAINETN